MKALPRIALAGLLALPLVACVTSRDDGERHVYAIEVDGVLCGYDEIHVSKAGEEGEEYDLVESKTFLLISLLGQKVERHVEATYHLDPATGRAFYFESHLRQGEVDLSVQVTIEGDRARILSSLDGREVYVPLPADVILGGDPTPLKRDFVDGGALTKTYDVLQPMESAVQPVTFVKVGTEVLELAGESREAVVLESLNEVTGVKAKLWIDTAEALSLQTESRSFKSYLADSSVKRKVEMAVLDDEYLTETNVAIADVHGISYMLVRATFEPTGMRLTSADLNVPGQRFEGTVEDNRVEGVFEIEHLRYDGAGAPPYPPSFTGEALAEHLAPGRFIESDDPVLVAKAREIAAGSRDSWEAARRLSRWVALNIGGEIPGGITARKTYDIRAGECGAHSFLLAAFCRAVGIPARVAFGCMYTPHLGGSFGQHAWTEVYMGEAGWIPVDTTALEVDFLDSGHIRLGIFESLSTALNAEAVEVLDHRLTGGAPQRPQEVTEKYAPFVGEYANPRGAPFEVLVKDGHLAVKIPDSLVLSLNDPVDDGIWRAQLTDKLYLTFPRDESGRVTEMKLHEIVRIRRTSEPKRIDDDVPEELRPYLGSYYLAPADTELVVLFDDGFFRDGNLALRYGGRTFDLSPTGEEGWWSTEYGGPKVSFDSGDGGEVTALFLDTNGSFRRI